MRAINVLYVVPSLKRTGPINQLFDLVANFGTDSVNPTVLALSHPKDESREHEFSAIGVPVINLNLPRLGSVIKGVSSAREAASAIQAQVVHTQGFRGDLVGAALSPNFPVFSTVHNFPQIDYSLRYGFLKGLVMSKIHMRLLRRFNRVVTVSQAAKENLDVHFKLPNSLAIPNGIDLSVYKEPNSDAKKAARVSLGLPLDGRIWISVGHLSDLKNPTMLIEAWKQKYAYSERNFLIFVGDGSDRAKCQEIAANTFSIMFSGRVNNVHEYLAASDVFLSASKTEGFHSAALEAMASGLPLVLSDIPAHREFFSNSGEIGTLFKVDDVENLRQSIDWIAASDLASLGARARESAVKNYAASRVSAMYVAAYKDEIIQ